LAIRRKAVLAAVLILAGSGVAAAQTGMPQTKTFVRPNAPIVSTGSPALTDPGINPSAAGLSQPRMAGPEPSGGARSKPPVAGKSDATKQK
jgi:hypothetical protein